MRRGRSVALAAAILVLASLGLSACGPDVEHTVPTVRRTLVFTVPGVTWGEVQSADLPNLDRLFRASAIGDVSTRIGREDASSTAAYLTIGAGTRAVVPGVDTGVALNPDELHGGIPASELLERRLGEQVDGIAYIPVGATVQANVDSPYGAEVGLLGDTLEAHGVGRAVIANADAAEGFPTDQPPPDGAFARSAATALMGSDGVVPDGTVGRGLLLDDPAAPFGRRLDPDAVLHAFDEVWDRPGKQVVLVEASDLSRAAAYGSRSTPTQARRLRAEALRTTDELLGRLLERVDARNDAVVVLTPTTRTTLGIASVRAPGTPPGLLRSATTRRDGYVYLADAMPTILELEGIEPPSSVEGRAFDVADRRGDRMSMLVDQAEAAATRDARLPIVVGAIVAALAVLAALTLVDERSGRRHRGGLRSAALFALGVVPASFLAGLVPATRTSDLWFALVVLSLAGVFGVAAMLAERRRRGLGALVAVGAILALVAIDLVAGAPLQVNSIFGYSMAVAGRFTGLGNLAFALFSSAAICFAVLAYDRWGPRAAWGIVAVLAAVVLLDGLPMLGADVGGVVATVPAFLLAGLALLGRKIGWREVALSVVVGLGVVAVFGLVDSSRPAASQTHLARIGEHLANGRIGSVGTILWRRVHASFGGDQVLVLTLAIGLLVVALLQAWLVARGTLGPNAPRRHLQPGTAALLIGGAALATLGLVANDSSIAVPATMLIVFVPVVVLRRTAA